MSKSYVQALEGQIASLELFIQKLALADPERREEMLQIYQPTIAASSEDGTTPGDEFQERNGSKPARARTGQLRKLTPRNCSQFYGGTSLFQIHFVGDATMPPGCDNPRPKMNLQMQESLAQGSSPNYCGTSIDRFSFAPHDDVSQRLLAVFFQHQYQYNMVIYREYFLRDYDTGTGRYYSDMLLYAICAMGALATDNVEDVALSQVFSMQAQALLYSSLDNPDLSALQALILLGQREIGHGRASKGWLFCGMAMRLAHEMGLHLDPNNWNGASEADVDREILRRVYWAAFIADKQLSLYFGRPVALYPHESDVRNTVRLPYPPDWENLLDIYIATGTSATAFEDGIALVGSFIYQAELAKIQHTIITDLFENRRAGADDTIAAATVQQIHVSLEKWLASLPGKLYWNQWTVGQVPSCVLHLHMRFHTAMIILHRPPRHLFHKSDMARSENVEICYESLQAIFRLMRSYARYYKYNCLPLDFVHTLSTAAGTILMRRALENLAWNEAETTRSLNFVLNTMDAISNAWPCVLEIKDIINQACQNEELDISPSDIAMDLSFFIGLSNPEEGCETHNSGIFDGNSIFDFDASS